MRVGCFINYLFITVPDSAKRKERHFAVMERGWQGRERKAKGGKWRHCDQKIENKPPSKQ